MAATPGESAPKIIAVFSDGTGNSAAKLFKTNVWRLYQALDLAEPDDPRTPRQVAFYDDGVGTSSFRPLALLGGAFGVGLKRNVLDLYTFLCRTYNDGDRIYAFGFSRGAFTIRVLVGLIAKEGVVCFYGEEDLAYRVQDAYRSYRRRYGAKNRIVGWLRDWRDGRIAAARKRRGEDVYDGSKNLKVAEIAFMGVWDTVAAYGTPFAELTRAIDKWIWPLSMPDYDLSEKVTEARHALALDDERDTFHPLLWNEAAEKEARAKRPDLKPDRLRQVWFAGMHADVGGGYPDDGLSQIPLAWMMREAEAAGLRFKAPDFAGATRAAHTSGPLHDSRRGLAAYYRYQPRRISARMEQQDPRALIMTDPERHAYLTSVKVHASVLERIASGSDDYAPIVLPETYEVVDVDPAHPPPPEQPQAAARRVDAQEWMWNDVWRRRVSYFATLGLSLLLILFPLLGYWFPPSACAGPQCLFVPPIMSLGVLLPGFVEPWLTSFGARPGTFLVIVIAIFLLMRRTGSLQLRIHDRMREVWEASLGLWPTKANLKAEEKAYSRQERRIHKLRTSALYQESLRKFKWVYLPNFLGVALRCVIAGAALLLVALLVLALQRIHLAAQEKLGGACFAVAPKLVLDEEIAAATKFDVRNACWSPEWRVEEGERYRIVLTVDEPWFDDSIPADPRGFTSDSLPWSARPWAAALRRSVSDRWFQPILRVAPQDAEELGWLRRKLVEWLGAPVQAFGRTTALEFQPHAAPGGSAYVATFEAPRSGAAFLFVNDALLAQGWGWIGNLLPGEGRGELHFYANNRGAATVRIERLE